jgi:hypothetical protein
MKIAQKQKLERWAERELLRNISHVIIDDDSGSYVAFGDYYLVPNVEGCTVSTWDRQIHTFANKRTAISWCVADKYQRYRLANNIRLLDTRKQQLMSDIRCRSARAHHSADEDFYDTVNTKLQPKETALASIINELEKCIDLAKYLQLRGFSNETA